MTQGNRGCREDVAPVPGRSGGPDPAIPVMVVGSLIAGWAAAVAVWNAIALPFHNEDEIVGPLTRIGFNPANNLVRFLVFAALPSVLLLVTYAIRNGAGSIRAALRALGRPDNVSGTGARANAIDIGVLLRLGILMDEIGQDNCVALTSEAAWPYLLRVPSTSRFFLIWFASPVPHQEELIRDIEVHKPQYLLVRSKHLANAIDGIAMLRRIPRVAAYVDANYSLDKVLSGYEIYRRNP